MKMVEVQKRSNCVPKNGIMPKRKLKNFLLFCSPDYGDQQALDFTNIFYGDFCKNISILILLGVYYDSI